MKTILAVIMLIVAIAAVWALVLTSNGPRCHFNKKELVVCS